MKIYKAVLTASFFILSAGIFWSHWTASTFPALHISMFVATLLIALYFAFGREQSLPYRPLVVIAPVIYIAVVYRTYLHLFPASMPGIDAVSYGSMTARLLRSGSIFAIETGFYESAPVSALIPTIFGLATDLPVSETVVIYPIALGIITPAATAALTLLIAPTKRIQMAGIATVFATVAAISVLFSFRPIAQSVGIVFWVIVVLLVARYSIYKSKRFLILLVIILVAQVFTHKLPLSIIFITLLIFSIISIILYSVRIELIDPSMIRSHGFTLAILAGVLLLVQWAYTTTFIKQVALWADIYSSAGSNVTVSPETAIQNNTTTEDVTVLQGGTGSQPRRVRAIAAHSSSLWGIIERRLYAFVSLPIGFLSGLYVNYKQWEAPTVKVLLVAAIVPGLFLVASLRNPITNPGATPPPERLVSFLEPVLIPFVSVIAGGLTVKSFGGTNVRQIGSAGVLKILSFLVIAVFLSSQLFTPAAALDYPGHERWYLNSQETQAKQFGYEYVQNGKIYTDWFTLVAGPPNSRLTGLDAEYRHEPYTSIGEPFVYGTIAEQQFEYVLIRTDVGVYKTRAGSYFLPYNPQESLNKKYNRIYSNNGAVIYIQPGE